MLLGSGSGDAASGSAAFGSVTAAVSLTAGFCAACFGILTAAGSVTAGWVITVSSVACFRLVFGYS